VTNSEHYISDKELAGYIDHTLLSATVTSGQIRQLCQEAKSYGFHTLCVNGRWVALAAELLSGSSVAVGGVVSLPLGADSTKIKVAQAKEAIFAGADEVDMVADLAAIIEADALSNCASHRGGFHQNQHGVASVRRSHS